MPPRQSRFCSKISKHSSLLEPLLRAARHSLPLPVLSQPPVLSPGIAHSTLRFPARCPLYNKDMKSTGVILGLFLLLASGCHQHPLMDYRPLDQAGMGSGTIEQLKPLNISDAEVQQLVNLKHSSVSDDTCVALISTAHSHHHLFTSSESVASLLGARYTESDIVGFSRADKLDAISGDAVMLRLIGLSDSTVQVVLQRDLQGLPTLSSAAIGTPQKHRPDGKADPGAHQRRHDRGASRKGSSIARSRSQSFAYRLRASARRQAALALPIRVSVPGSFGQSATHTNHFCLSPIR